MGSNSNCSPELRQKGLFGAVILGLGRALGETMAVTMVIGNTPQIALSLFKPGYTLASVIANEFTEATTDLYLQALFAIALVLFGITILANLVAQLLPQDSRRFQHYQGRAMISLTDNNHRWRKIKSALASAIAFVSALLVIAPLGLVFFYLLASGASSVNWDFFTQLPAPVERRRRHGQRDRRDIGVTWSCLTRWCAHWRARWGLPG